VSDVRLDAHGSPRLVILSGLVLAVACLYWARIVFIPIALALLITFLLSPEPAVFIPGKYDDNGKWIDHQ